MQSKKEVQVFSCLLAMHLTMEVLLGNSVSLHLDNLLPGLASLISEEISIELENLCAEPVRSFLCLISCLSGFIEFFFSCNDCGLKGFVTLCLLELFGLVRSGLASFDCLL